MKKFFFLCLMTMGFGMGLYGFANLPQEYQHANKVAVQMFALGQEEYQSVGEVLIVETKYGLAFFPKLQGIKPGSHGFHIHENPDCGATQKGLGLKAGGHWDPEGTKKHSYPWDDNGHKGDLPVLIVDSMGQANQPVLAPKIKSIYDISNRALMVHVGGDNHSDSPNPLGGGGSRMICGIIKAQ